MRNAGYDMAVPTSQNDQDDGNHYTEIYADNYTLNDFSTR
jgi:hypothetical protein